MRDEGLDDVLQIDAGRGAVGHERHGPDGQNDLGQDRRVESLAGDRETGRHRRVGVHHRLDVGPQDGRRRGASASPTTGGGRRAASRTLPSGVTRIRSRVRIMPLLTPVGVTSIDPSGSRAEMLPSFAATKNRS